MKIKDGIMLVVKPTNKLILYIFFPDQWDRNDFSGVSLIHPTFPYNIEIAKVLCDHLLVAEFHLHIADLIWIGAWHECVKLFLFIVQKYTLKNHRIPLAGSVSKIPEEATNVLWSLVKRHPPCGRLFFLFVSPIKRYNICKIKALTRQLRNGPLCSHWTV